MVARFQVAHVLVRSLVSDHASRNTFDLVATKGSAQDDFDAVFGALAACRAEPSSIPRLQAKLKPCLVMGKVRIRSPVAAKIALQTAGRIDDGRSVLKR